MHYNHKQRFFVGLILMMSSLTKWRSFGVVGLAIYNFAYSWFSFSIISHVLQHWRHIVPPNRQRNDLRHKKCAQSKSIFFAAPQMKAFAIPRFIYHRWYAICVYVNCLLAKDGSHHLAHMNVIHFTVYNRVIHQSCHTKQTQIITTPTSIKPCVEYITWNRSKTGKKKSVPGITWTDCIGLYAQRYLVCTYTHTHTNTHYW